MYHTPQQLKERRDVIRRRRDYYDDHLNDGRHSPFSTCLLKGQVHLMSHALKAGLGATFDEAIESSLQGSELTTAEIERIKVNLVNLADWLSALDSPDKVNEAIKVWNE